MASSSLLRGLALLLALFAIVGSARVQHLLTIVFIVIASFFVLPPPHLMDGLQSRFYYDRSATTW